MNGYLRNDPTEGARTAPLIDAYGRRIRYLRISITDRCNLRCRYCMPDEGVQWLPHEGILRYEEFLRIIRICASRGVDKVRVTGGEPLIRKGLLDFIARIREIDGIQDLSLTTNGVLLASMAGDLRSAGVKRLNISLDTLDRQKFAYITHTDAFEHVWAGIQAAMAEGLHVKLNVVAIRGFNDDEIQDFARLTLHEPLDVRFIELMPVGCAARFGPEHTIQAGDIREIIRKTFNELKLVETGLGPATMYRLAGAGGRIGFIEPLSERGFCSRCNRIRISANGQLRPCLMSDQHLDILEPLRQGIDDTELEALIVSGVYRKPPTGFTSVQGCATLMSKIGG